MLNEHDLQDFPKIRYFRYLEQDESTGADLIITVSEEDIRRDYYPYWLGKMHNKFGEEYVALNYTFEDALDDWIVGNWAVEVIV